MTNPKFQKLLNDLSKATETYRKLLKDAEDELENRFGKSPSDIDNDYWIDTFHVGMGKMTVKEAEKSMKEHLKYHKD